MDPLKSNFLGGQTLAAIVRREVAGYVGKSYQVAMYALMDDEQQRYAVVDIPFDRKQFQSGVVVMAHIEDDLIVIDEDNTDKPLFEALMVNAGIPREQIVLAYAGELIPEMR